MPTAMHSGALECLDGFQVCTRAYAPANLCNDECAPANLCNGEHRSKSAAAVPRTPMDRFTAWLGLGRLHHPLAPPRRSAR